MGLFSKLGLSNAEAPSAEASAENKAEVPKAEQKELSSADTGRERVNAAMEDASKLWTRITDSAKSLKKSFSTKARDAFSMALGSLKKLGGHAVEGALTFVGDVEKTGKAVAEAAKDTKAFVSESVSEGMDILDAVNDASNEVATASNETVDLVAEAIHDASAEMTETVIAAGYTGAALAIMKGKRGVALGKEMARQGIDIGTEAAKTFASDAAELAQVGIDALNVMGDSGVKNMGELAKTAREAKAAGLDLAKTAGSEALTSLLLAAETGVSVVDALAGAAGEALKDGAEIYGVAKERVDALRGSAKEAKNSFFGRIASARNAFSSKLKGMVLEAFSSDIDDKVKARVDKILAERDALSVDIAVERDEDEDDGVVEYVAR